MKKAMSVLLKPWRSHLFTFQGTIVKRSLLVRRQDQMEHLERLKVRAESINSKMSASERQRVWTDLQAVVPSTRLLYITPEQADTNGFQVHYTRTSRHKQVSGTVPQYTIME